MLALELTLVGPNLRHDFTPSRQKGEALIRLEVGGVCATDLELLRGYMGFFGVLGHEWVGVVEECDDPEVSSSLVGKRVVGEINCSCHRCETCLRGDQSHCPNRSVMGIQDRDGAFSERFCLPIRNLHLVPDGVSSDAAVFTEPLAAAVEICEALHVHPTDKVIVLGVGRLGQLVARVLQLTGAEVIGVGRSEHRLNLLPPGIKRCNDTSQLGQADIVVDCTGSPEGLSVASQLVRPRGQLVIKTTTHKPPPIAVTNWVINETTVVGSRCGPYAPALRLLASGLVDPTPLISSRFMLSDGVASLQAAADRSQTKVLIDPP